MKTELVVIQPTSYCNINCRYCYLPHRDRTRRISEETLSRIFEELFSSPFVGEAISFVWHTGEPLTLPISFYERAFELQRRWNVNGVRISNDFQTNATLITQKWCQFFKAHDVHIGISLDGPQHIHDMNRVDRAGRGTFDRVSHSIELLRANHIDYAVIAVITRDTVAHPDDFWQFFADLHPVRLSLNPEEAEGANEQSSLKTEEDILRYQKFFARLAELNEQSQHPLSIREINVFMRHILLGKIHTHTQMNVPMAILSFDCDGNVSTFAPELLTMSHPVYHDFIFGNVFKGTLADMSTHPKLVEINEQIQQGVTWCQNTCKHFAFCGGGSPSNKFFENGTFDSTETTACRLQVKVTTDVLLKQLEEKYYLEGQLNKQTCVVASIPG